MSNNVLIIAEAGVNHNGEIALAKNLIDIASHAGADIVKFQTFKTENILEANAPKAGYQIQTTGIEESQFEMVKKFELDFESHIELMEYCKIKNIEFLSSPFDLDSIDVIQRLGLEIFKIPSGELTNLPYLRKIGKIGSMVILSTGMADLAEVESALNILIDSGTNKEDITILHCNTEYPTPFEDVNLNAMLTIRDKLGVDVGYSDHTTGIEIPIAAVALGATIIEKHITINRNLKGPDHKSSLEPHELKNMVTAIRNIEVALGDGIKKPSSSEIANKDIVRKSIHIKKSLPKGHIIESSDLVMKRPGYGISPMLMDSLIGRKLVIDLKSDELLKWDHLH